MLLNPDAGISRRTLLFALGGAGLAACALCQC